MNTRHSFFVILLCNDNKGIGLYVREKKLSLEMNITE